jgi:hypothetical protein
MEICQSCHERERVNHRITVTDGVIHKADLYGECFERFASQDVRELSASHYFFCGGKFNVGQLDEIAHTLGIHRIIITIGTFGSL